MDTPPVVQNERSILLGELRIPSDTLPHPLRNSAPLLELPSSGPTYPTVPLIRANAPRIPALPLPEIPHWPDPDHVVNDSTEIHGDEDRDLPMRQCLV